jgi:alpha-L-arabinofuranosidase
MRRSTLLLAALAVGAAALAQDPGRLTVKVDQPGPKISPMLYGLMTEEINHSYDGGLYAELIRNRAFKDDPKRPAFWSLVTSDGSAGTIALDTVDPVNTTALTTSLRLDLTTVPAGGRVGVANGGYWGVPVKPHTTYRASFYAKATGGFAGPLTLSLESNDGATTFASATVAAIGGGWQRYSATLTTSDAAASTGNRFVLSAGHAGTLWLSLVSLFPPTYHDRPNGNRADLMQLLGDMQPAFLRLPGGNYLEGDFIAEHFAWKNTLGDIALRPGHRCCWGYPSTDGMGLLEYLEWCEDLNMEPVLAVYAGYSLRGEVVKPGPDLEPFVQEGMDEIEYVIGDETTTWGKRRIADGHPAPFPLHYVEIGNEDGFDRLHSYDGRYAQFYDAIKAKYPKLQVIATAGVHLRTPDVIDDHYYRSAREMERDVHHYDRTPRTGPKIFVGEWASTEGSPTPTMQAALGDAAWLTGLERNSDVVVLASYAPLLVNVNRGAAQWGTNLIGYDAGTAFGSPSYHAQKLFGRNRGDTVLPVEIGQPTVPPAAAPTLTGGVGVGTWLTQAEYKDLQVSTGDKVLYKSDFSRPSTRGWRLRNGQWQVAEGVLRQTAGDAIDCVATTGGRDWGDCTYRLKARKIGGAEGFLILFHAKDEANWIWWNLGGWGNQRTALEQCSDGGKHEIGQSQAVSIDTGRWYDIRIECQGHQIRCFLDDKLITEATDEAAAPVGPLFATASRVDASGEVIVKLVNVGGADQRVAMELQGVTEVAPGGVAWVLSGQPGDVNSVAEPEKVAPKQVALEQLGPKFSYDAPAYSVSVLRLKAK